VTDRDQVRFVSGGEAQNRVDGITRGVMSFKGDIPRPPKSILYGIEQDIDRRIAAITVCRRAYGEHQSEGRARQ
jgi:hypothetical protein